MLASALDRLMAFGTPDLAIYVSGADPFEGDRLGRLSLTVEGLAARDALVFATLRGVGVPVAVAMAGGYGKDVHETVTIHANTVAAATQWAEGPGAWPLPRRTNGDKQPETDDD
jgi:acetoin utilization deacetylase AcuC-like enzyme